MRGFLVVAAMAFLASPAFAADDVMAGYYGNTAIATGGMTDTHTTFSADHTFDMRVPAFHMDFKGSWKLDGTQICRTFDSPPPGVTNPLCTPVAAHKVGDTWTATADGKARTIKLVQGIQ